MNQLYYYFKSSIGFASKEIDQAFAKINRADFVPKEYETEADADYPLPLGFGATISQPTTVAFMLNKLDPRPKDKILDVGTGSGWTTALLSAIVGNKGQVFGTEIIEELVQFGNNNLMKYKINNAKIVLASKELGLPKSAPYDRILVSAAAQKLPESLIQQLKIAGRMVIPVRESVFVIDKISETEIKKKEYPGFAFVPLKQTLP